MSCEITVERASTMPSFRENALRQAHRLLRSGHVSPINRTLRDSIPAKGSLPTLPDEPQWKLVCEHDVRPIYDVLKLQVSERNIEKDDRIVACTGRPMRSVLHGLTMRFWNRPIDDRRAMLRCGFKPATDTDGTRRAIDPGFICDSIASREPSDDLFDRSYRDWLGIPREYAFEYPLPTLRDHIKSFLEHEDALDPDVSRTVRASLDSKFGEHASTRKMFLKLDIGTVLSKTAKSPVERKICTAIDGIEGQIASVSISMEPNRAIVVWNSPEHGKLHVLVRIEHIDENGNVRFPTGGTYGFPKLRESDGEHGTMFLVDDHGGKNIAAAHAAILEREHQFACKTQDVLDDLETTMLKATGPSCKLKWRKGVSPANTDPGTAGGDETLPPLESNRPGNVNNVHTVGHAQATMCCDIDVPDFGSTVLAMRLTRNNADEHNHVISVWTPYAPLDIGVTHDLVEHGVIGFPYIVEYAEDGISSETGMWYAAGGGRWFGTKPITGALCIGFERAWFTDHHMQIDSTLRMIASDPLTYLQIRPISQERRFKHGIDGNDRRHPRNP